MLQILCSRLNDHGSATLAGERVGKWESTLVWTWDAAEGVNKCEKKESCIDMWTQWKG